MQYGSCPLTEGMEKNWPSKTEKSRRLICWQRMGKNVSDIIDLPLIEWSVNENDRQFSTG
jgi:hypothetical protein